MAGWGLSLQELELRAPALKKDIETIKTETAMT